MIEPRNIRFLTQLMHYIRNENIFFLQKMFRRYDMSKLNRHLAETQRNWTLFLNQINNTVFPNNVRIELALFSRTLSFFNEMFVLQRSAERVLRLRRNLTLSKTWQLIIICKTTKQHNVGLAVQLIITRNYDFCFVNITE